MGVLSACMSEEAARKALDLLELELQAVSVMRVAGIKPKSFGKAVSALMRPLSPDPPMLFDWAKCCCIGTANGCEF